MHLILVCICKYKNILIELFRCVTVLRQRQRYGLIDKSTIILTVNDPQDKIGSGGATLNALLMATQFLSAKAGYSVS
jgi:fucokinase